MQLYLSKVISPKNQIANKKTNWTKPTKNGYSYAPPCQKQTSKPERHLLITAKVYSQSEKNSSQANFTNFLCRKAV